MFTFERLQIQNRMKELTLKEALQHVAEFHDKFGIKYNLTPTLGKEEMEYELRHRLMQEENNEYLEAVKNDDLVEVADALGDMLYILCGTILKHGMQDVISEVFEEIQRSNLSKLGADGKPIYRKDGKVLKGENYFRPDIAKILSQKK